MFKTSKDKNNNYTKKIMKINFIKKYLGFFLNSLLIILILTLYTINLFVITLNKGIVLIIVVIIYFFMNLMIKNKKDGSNSRTK